MFLKFCSQVLKLLIFSVILLFRHVDCWWCVLVNVAGCPSLAWDEILQRLLGARTGVRVNGGGVEWKKKAGGRMESLLTGSITPLRTG